MTVYDGRVVSEGIAIGKLYVHTKDRPRVERVVVADTAVELARYAEARGKAVEELKALYDKAFRELGESGAKIFAAYQVMVDDEDYIASVKSIIETESVNAEYAVSATGEHFAKMVAGMEEEYFRGRETDVRDITGRLLNILTGTGAGGVRPQEPVIVVADDLSPSEAVQMDRDAILSLVTVHGSVNSHTAILARTMGIPAVIGCPVPLAEDMNGKTAVVDGYEGKLYVEPDPEILLAKEKLLCEETERKKLAEELKGRESITCDGQRIRLCANIGGLRDLEAALRNGADGVGLFRTEFLYLDADHFPTEEEQFAIYRQVAQTLSGREVVIRTLDIGADKQVDYFGFPKEENPALGLRAIRICLTRPDVFRAQLRAILRASMFGKVSVMFPMITSVGEVKRIKEIVAEVMRELDAEGIAYDRNIELGVMIETPAAVMLADELAGEVGFFSVGTNDLTQYTLAVDRQNESLAEFYDPHHPAVLKMLRMVADAAHRHGIKVGICGELGADPSLTKDFLAMGYDELSVSPGRILPLRKIVLETDVAEYKKQQERV